MQTQKKTSILLVDDERDFLILAKRYLEKYNSSLTINTAPSGKEAFQLHQIYKFEVIVSDYEMPDMTGLQLTAITCSNQPYDG